MWFGDPMTRQEMGAIEACYEWHAAEGRCSAPIMEGVTRSDTASEDDDRTVRQVLLRFRDDGLLLKIILGEVPAGE